MRTESRLFNELIDNIELASRMAPLPFSNDQQRIINQHEEACAAAGCDDDGHKCS